MISNLVLQGTAMAEYYYEKDALVEMIHDLRDEGLEYTETAREYFVKLRMISVLCSTKIPLV